MPIAFILWRQASTAPACPGTQDHGSESDLSIHYSLPSAVCSVYVCSVHMAEQSAQSMASHQMRIAFVLCQPPSTAPARPGARDDGSGPALSVHYSLPSVVSSVYVCSVHMTELPAQSMAEEPAQSMAPHQLHIVFVLWRRACTGPARTVAIDHGT
eukprot:gene17968-24373_t